MNKKWIHDRINYYLASIKDVKKVEIEHDLLTDESEISLLNMENGYIPEKVVKYLFSEVYQKKKDYEQAINQNWSINVQLCPIVMFVTAEHQQIKNLPEKVVPISMLAKLNAKGHLQGVKVAPWVVRKLLHPTKLSDFAVKSLEEVDNFLSLNPAIDEGKEWSTYWQELIKLVNFLGAKTLTDFKLNQYVQGDKAYIVAQTKPMHTTLHLERLYEHILNVGERSYNSLLGSIMTVNRNQQATMSFDKQVQNSACHYGQMKNEFALSESQRESLVHFIEGEGGEGEVFAVNGPPGTGKTTLLQSIIADLFVKKALQDKGPPIILATSNNNQAVTNIIDSFGDVFDGEDKLGMRWIPDAKSFGTYFASSSKAKKASDKYLLLTANGPKLSGYENNLMSLSNQKVYVDYYLEHVNSYYSGANILNVNDAKTHLKKSLKQVTDTIQFSINTPKLAYDGIDRILAQYKENPLKVMNEYRERLKILEENQKMWHALEVQFEKYINGLSIFKRLLIKLGFFPLLFIGDLRRFTRNYVLLEDYNGSYNYRDLICHIIKCGDENKENIRFCKDEIRKLEVDLNKIAEHESMIQKILDKLNIVLDLKKTTREVLFRKINECLDKTKRYEAFRLATHIYEGDWIEESLKNLKSKYEDSKSPDKKKTHLSRIAKLTPCFVSTFYMIPKLFETGYKPNDNWINEYLHNFIDLLIIDEAGQASPEVILPVFSLAKKAVIVGDELQIEPVWSVEGYSDQPNAELYMKDIVWKDFVDTKYAASSGNVMRIAKQSSKYRKNGEGGLFLCEHRRCLKEIIAYNNVLAYNGRLLPMRDEELKDYPYPHMGHRVINGKCTKKNSSRLNQVEASAIANWLVDHGLSIIDCYKEEGSEPPLISDLVAVVTPFKAQSNEIKKHLRRHRGFENITVGTVHSLQGAERKIVIFSSVYDGHDINNYFYDKGVNMLNVAVSRAKDSFLVFGDDAVVNANNKTHSGLLASYLTKF